jgi:hypothetical protein
MANTSSRSKLRFAYSYGLVGGQANSRKMTKLLHNAGYHLAKTPSEADIIIAHSAGCWLIPRDVSPKIVIYIGMPLVQSNLRQSFLSANLLSFKREYILRTLRTKLLTSYYSLRQPVRNLNIIRMAKTAKPVLVPEAVTVFIANRHDPWPQSEKLENYTKKYPWTFINMSGTHDDIWEHPDRYVAIIDHYAGLLV